MAADTTDAIGRRRSAPAASSSSSTPTPSSASICRRRCRPTTSRSTVEDLLPFLKRVTPSDERARQALALLAAWNGVMDKDRPEPLIYTAFMRALHRIMLVEKTGLSMSEKGPFAADDADRAAHRPSRMVRRAGQARSGLPRDARRGRSTKGLAELVVKRDGADMSQWRWGREHVALLQHKVYSHIPLLDRHQRPEHALERRLLHARSRRRLRHARRPAVRAHPWRRLSRRSTISPTPTSRASSSPPANPATSSRRTIATSAPLWIDGKSITLAGERGRAEARRRAGARPSRRNRSDIGAHGLKGRLALRYAADWREGGGVRLLAVGAGSTGGYFGGRLAQAGRDVTFLVRPGRAAKLRESGLRIVSPHGDATLHPKVVTPETLAGDLRRAVADREGVSARGRDGRSRARGRPGEHDPAGAQWHAAHGASGAALQPA